MKRKYCAIIIVLLVFLKINAQNNTNSPYTMYGIGYIEPGGFGKSKALGGAGIALPSGLSLNNMNPASYHGIDSLHFLLEAGVNSIYSKFKSNTGTQENLNANFSYLAIGFRINKWWGSSLGITPYSNVGYSINSRQQIEGTTEYSNISIKGSGGLNQFYWGNSFSLNKNIALGINASYIFGTISMLEKTSNDYFSGTINVEDESTLNNLYLDYGVQYTFNINNNWKSTIGAVYGNKTRLNKEHRITITDNTSDTLSSEKKSSSYYIPQYYGVGASVSFKDNLLITADYSQSNWSDIDNFASGTRVANSQNIAGGIEFLPSQKPSASFYQKIKYRVGGYYENSYMKINGNQLSDYGITAGFGIPVMKGKTFINLAVSAGRKGYPGSGSIINEDYVKVNLNFTLIDFWFNRIKFN